ncbi:MAG: MFS transporter, partial [Candidatus Omnitrophota bacterium]|nr:MFS transporter [Candidatus Omnitrophota bacterium]
WLVYRMTNSPLLLGIVGFASQIPSFIFAPFAGLMADRFNRHRLLIITQVLSMAQALILALLAITGAIEVWHIIVLGAFLGCINALDIPARQSFIVEMVERKEDLGNAIALNSLMFNAARLIGPSIAGLLIAMAGEGICFTLNAISFLAVLASLLAMKISARPLEKRAPDMLKELKEGFVYTFGFPPIRFIILLLAVISLMGASYAVLMPVFARDILKGGPETFGLLMAGGGVGALVATLYLASRRSIVGLGKLIPISSGVFSAGLILFALSHNVILSMSLLAIAGFGFMAHMAASNTILQTIVDDDKRGRVMSFYSMAFMGMTPIGSLLAGVLAVKIGAANTLILGASCCIAASAAFAAKLPLIKKLVHPIYRKIGIIPEVASGIAAVTRITLPPED